MQLCSTSSPQAGRDYAALRDSLKEGDFQKADDITRDELIQLAGPGAVKRNWVYFSGVLASTQEQA
jgi:GUN4-like